MNHTEYQGTYIRLVHTELFYSDECDRKSPCRHKVINIDTNEESIMDGREICSFLEEKKLRVPRHFEKYKK